MSRIVWLASYPKSGNTWLRIFLQNYRADAGQPVDINALDISFISSLRVQFDDAIGIKSSDLTHAEIDQLRPLALRIFAMRLPAPVFFKSHDVYYLLPDGTPLFPSDVSRGAVYIVRNPLDVAVSYASFFRLSLDQAIDAMATPHNQLAVNQRHLLPNLRQHLDTWSQHVYSWTTQTDMPLVTIRYEDMHLNPEEAFAAVVSLVGWPLDMARLRRAIDYASFDHVRQQESSGGFREKIHNQAPFFRQGKIGTWRDALTDAQAQRIVHMHGDVMRQWGYLDERDQIVFDAARHTG